MPGQTLSLSSVERRSSIVELSTMTLPQTTGPIYGTLLTGEARQQTMLLGTYEGQQNTTSSLVT